MNLVYTLNSVLIFGHYLDLNVIAVLKLESLVLVVISSRVNEKSISFEKALSGPPSFL